MLQVRFWGAWRCVVRRDKIGHEEPQNTSWGASREVGTAIQSQFLQNRNPNWCWLFRRLTAAEVSLTYSMWNVSEWLCAVVPGVIKFDMHPRPGTFSDLSTLSSSVLISTLASQGSKDFIRYIGLITIWNRKCYTFYPDFSERRLVLPPFCSQLFFSKKWEEHPYSPICVCWVLSLWIFGTIHWWNPSFP